MGVIILPECGGFLMRGIGGFSGDAGGRSTSESPWTGVEG